MQNEMPPSFPALQRQALRSWMQNHRPMVGSFPLANFLDLGPDNRHTADHWRLPRCSSGPNTLQCPRPLPPKSLILSSARSYAHSNRIRQEEMLACSLGSSWKLLIAQRVTVRLRRLQVQSSLSCRERWLRGGVRATERAKRSFSPQFASWKPSLAIFASVALALPSNWYSIYS